MEQLFVEIVPNFYNDITDLMLLFGEIFAGGVVLAFLVWVVGFAVRGVFGMLEAMVREEG